MCPLVFGKKRFFEELRVNFICIFCIYIYIATVASEGVPNHAKKRSPYFDTTFTDIQRGMATPRQKSFDVVPHTPQKCRNLRESRVCIPKAPNHKTTSLRPLWIAASWHEINTEIIREEYFLYLPGCEYMRCMYCDPSIPPRGVFGPFGPKVGSRVENELPGPCGPGATKS